MHMSHGCFEDSWTDSICTLKFPLVLKYFPHNSHWALLAVDSKEIIMLDGQVTKNIIAIPCFLLFSKLPKWRTNLLTLHEEPWRLSRRVRRSRWTTETLLSSTMDPESTDKRFWRRNLPSYASVLSVLLKERISRRTRGWEERSGRTRWRLQGWLSVEHSQEIVELVKKLDIRLEFVNQLVNTFEGAQHAVMMGLRGAPDPRIFRAEALRYCKTFGDTDMQHYNTVMNSCGWVGSMSSYNGFFL